MSLETSFRESVVNYAAPRLDMLVDVQAESGAEDEVLKLMAAGGRPIMYANHHGWGDGWAIIRVVQHLRNLTAREGIDFPGVVMPIARTISTGHYGAPLKHLYNLFDNYFAKKGVITAPYTRDKDIKLGLKRPIGETIRITRAMNRGYGVEFFPEASVQGGRHKNGILGFVFGGEINGMIDLTDHNYFSSFYEQMDRFGNVSGEIFFLPVALNGSYRFFGADIPIPTFELALGLFKDSSNPIQATMLSPITSSKATEEIGKDWRIDGVTSSHYFMNQFTRVLPHEAWGVYLSH